MRRKDNQTRKVVYGKFAKRVKRHPVSDDFPISMAFGAELFRLRNLAGQSQTETAYLAGLTRGYYGQIENSRKPPPPPSTLRRIQFALALQEDDFRVLKCAAEVERCLAIGAFKELPTPMARLIRQLLAKIYCLSPEQLKRIATVLDEEAAM